MVAFQLKVEYAVSVAVIQERDAEHVENQFGQDEKYDAVKVPVVEQEFVAKHHDYTGQTVKQSAWNVQHCLFLSLPFFSVYLCCGALR